ncbi:septum formation family protein [Aquihabitans sp. McL0605]|uniref:septum formation family protein n=1 Tax=Aquihabitans sp. McL0605 TaxID=3415671 RepID=UPI003CF193E8
MGWRAALGAAALAIGVASATASCTAAGDHSKASGSTSTTYVLTYHDYQRGDCVAWDQQRQKADARAIAIVPCSKPHVMEITGSTEVRDDGTGYPTAQASDLRVRRPCTAKASALLGQPLEADGRFSLYGLGITPEGWQEGERTYWCGLAEMDGTDGTGRLAVMRTGDARGASQRLIIPAGTCHSSYHQQVAQPHLAALVPCDQPHGWESIGSAKATAPKGAPYPSTADLRRQVDARCDALLKAYAPSSAEVHAGKVVATRLGMTVTDWAAGEREFQCLAERPPGPDLQEDLLIDHSIRG